ncbi:hypothetical protein [Massilia sp. LjRoot122]|uniref:hypothetical protein n=1 Tax=Massilia sp. LjRoot122 TaxID=3342257 RepID=UPI003ECE04ED
MTCEFIPADQLKKQFRVLGHFYNVVVGGQRVFCRSSLEIVRDALFPNRLDAAPDAIVVMMNPGSSQPLATVPEEVDHTAFPFTRKNLVATKPDTTQYQIMRLMHYCGWDHVRVLNLSDLREASSASFVKQYRSLEAEHNYSKHSIFCPSRKRELSDSLRRSSDAPIISAWGTSAKLDPLIQRCTHAINERGQFVGLKHVDGFDRYLHPLPRMQEAKQAWVDDMVKLVQTL